MNKKNMQSKNKYKIIVNLWYNLKEIVYLSKINLIILYNKILYILNQSLINNNLKLFQIVLK
jgi:hypothetical protein